MRERTKWVFYFLLALPIGGLVYAVMTNRLGANPAETLNKKLGQFTLYLFLLNLYWGSFEALIDNRILKPWFALRRTIGVATFIYACLHFLSYFLREGELEVAFKQLITKPYLIFGLSALVVMLPLALTSNNWAVRKLKFKKWKMLHRAVYGAFFLISTHIFLIEKRSPLANKYTLFPMIAVLFVRICQGAWLRLKFHHASQKKV
jgi:sulfoxide reductase heme-binding subunit YedZ